MDNGRTVLARGGSDLEGEVAYLREQLRLTFDLAPIAQGVLRFDGMFEQVNDAMCSMLGYSREELLARSMPSISHPDEMPANLKLQRSLLSGHISSYHMDKRYIRADREIVWVSLSVAIMWTRDGEPRMLGQLVDITERKRSEARLAHEATHDSLTGLPNRRLLLDVIDGALTALPPDGSRTVALLFCNIDQFNVYNDTYGHTLGDRLLVAVAERLSGALIAGEQLGRFGGDELIVVSPEVRATGGIQSQDRVGSSVGGGRPDPTCVARAVADRRASVLRDGVHRHRPRPPTDHLRRRHGQRSEHRDVRGQASRPEPGATLRRRVTRHDAQPTGARVRAADRARQRRCDGLVPTDRRPCRRDHPWVRGTRSLEPSSSAE